MEPFASFSIKASDGIELAADVWNHDAKATLFLLPAGAETRAVWRPVIDRSGAEVRSNWRIVAADHRGHGGSGRSETYQFEQFYCDLGKWIAELAADPLVVTGGSIGGALGMVAAEKVRPLMAWCSSMSRWLPCWSVSCLSGSAFNQLQRSAIAA